MTTPRERYNKRLKNNKYKTESALRHAKNSLYSSELKERATLPELIVYNYLTSKGIYFMFQKGFLKPFHRIVDFYLPKPKNIIIEVDGGYHKDTVEKDFYKDLVWKQKGFKTIRITNEEVESGDFSKLDFI